MDKEPILTGLPASSGTAEGIVRVVTDDFKSAEFNDNEILVTHLTDPTMVGMMVKAAAIVTNIGGITSHPAILSREMGIPCVVNTKTATTTLTNGQHVRVDGTQGHIYVLD